MSSIQTYLNNIMNAVYGEEVRSSIKNAIQQCYDDVNNPSLLTTGINTIISQKVADGTISSRILTDIGVLTEPTDNLFDFSKVTNGLLSSSNGTVNTGDPNYWTSDYIQVTSGKTYYFTNTYVRVFYNRSKSFSSNISGTTFTPASNGYVRVCTTNANRMKAMVKETSGTTYIPGRTAIDYYLRNNTYTKGEVNTLIANISLTTAQKSELIGLLEDTAPIPN